MADNSLPRRTVTLRKPMHPSLSDLLTESSTRLPAEVLAFLTFNSVKRVTWASYGSAPKSWFFVYELTDGTSAFELGKDIPAALRQFIDVLTPDLSSSLRVQLGNDNSFVAWAKTCWACDGIPLVLENELADLRGSYRRTHIDMKGSLKAAIDQVAWHSDGSYYLEGKEGYFWNFTSIITRKEWTKLWSKGDVKPRIKELSELAVSGSLLNNGVY
jgi:methylenetetrahydrofolate dehydrogenase (NADP+)/methenyltetrahydrofolate cyclohydrolase/formyltetrahydrofolate synthetase